MNKLKQEVKATLKSLDTRPRKRMSQNFMVSEKALETIVGALGLKESDSVLEIGPGLGFLTRELAARAGEVVAVEKDKRFCAYLQEQFASRPRLRIREADILEFAFENELPSPPYVCAGNIPYQITSPLLEVLTRHRRLWANVTLTVQKDVALRLGAGPGSKDRSPLSCWLQMHAEIRIIHHFRRTDFYPVPRVDSSLVRIDFRSKPLYAPEEEGILRACIRAAFQQRRKSILNGLAAPATGLTKPAARACLEEAGIDPSLRPERLTLEDWLRVGRGVKNAIEK